MIPDNTHPLSPFRPLELLRPPLFSSTPLLLGSTQPYSLAHGLIPSRQQRLAATATYKASMSFLQISFPDGIQFFVLSHTSEQTSQAGGERGGVM